MTSATERADEYWAAVFDVEVGELRRPGLHTTLVDEPNSGIYVLSIGEAVHIRAPMRLRDAVEAVASTPSPLDTMRPETWRRIAGSGNEVLGPASHFLGSDDVRSMHPEAEPSLAELQQLSAGIAADELDESGVLEPGVRRFGLWRDGRLLAVSALSTWIGAPTDVGLLVSPRSRGHGVGREVAAIALSAAIRGSGIARWRCREDNAASMALARGFGLQPYARNLGIRLSGAS